MDRKNLLGYLTTVLELEKQCRTMYVSIQKYDGWMNELKQIENQAEIAKPRDKPIYNFEASFLSVIFGLVMCGLLGLVLLVVGGGLDFLVEGLGTLLLWGGYGVWIFGLLMVGNSIILSIKEMSAGKKRHIEEKERYIIAVANREKDIANAAQKRQNILQDKQTLYKQYVATKKTLDDYYALNVIYPSYRSIVPVAMFTQYIQSQRCDKLEGTDGAYNKYEDELRQNIIIAKLDVIIAKLDRIASSQYELQQTLLESNRQILTMCQAQMQAQERHNRVIEYQNQQAIQTQQAIGQYVMYRDLVRT